jgi:hypothetical protein
MEYLFAEKWQKVWYPKAMWLTLLAMGALTLHNVYNANFGWVGADWLLISEGVALAGGVLLSMQLEGRFRAAVSLMSMLKVLPETAPMHLNTLFRQRLVANSLFCFLPVVALIIVADIWFFEVGFNTSLRTMLSGPLPIMLFAVLGSCIAAGRVGAAVTMAGLAQELTRESSLLTLRPDHPDGLNGMEPLSRYYQEQALMLIVPCFWATIWLLALPAFDGYPLPDYRLWRGTIIGIWLLSLVFILLGFYRPAYLLREAMRLSKAVIQRTEGAALAREFSTLDDNLRELTARGASTQETAVAIEKSMRLQARLFSIVTIKEWPINPRDHLKFLSKPFTLFVLPALTSVWEKLSA